MVAVGGDQVKIDNTGIVVNGESLKKSEPAVFFLEPANMDRKLALDEILVASDYNILSYDSRYFGVLKTAAIVSTVEPLWTGGTPNETLNERGL